ncbi:large subunit ribosomal protein L7Ae [Nematocida homosporus]|uniref:large subunit ribosomal protein L7Ae n=1 Tax=Nematocida homosporus TaxID=1912981 RepID=UPI002220AD64|nr:large subunit ribosomal protein L7Ae [Nematocida homosporus]KAI5185415.1 large subunit ribosomal protein L7Ae [Nematocida homosporus]
MQAIQTVEYKQKTPRNKRGGGQKHTADIAKAEAKAQDRVIQKKKAALTNALSCPPAIHQFSQKMDEDLKTRIAEVFGSYKPETPEERLHRVENKQEKKLSLVFGLRQIVKLIEKKKAKLVLIANNVDPIVVVLFLPSLCKKMGVSYAIYDTKENLGALVGRKQAACVAIDTVVPGLEGLITEVNEQFSDRYDQIMRQWSTPGTKQ